MNIKEIRKDIFYVGVNDRVTDLFERLWPLPHGVTYNSYIIKDNSCVLIDTVEPADFSAYIRNIKNTVGDEKIDYLVVNHMEPDHSGSLPEILRIYPDIKIIGNALTVQMIKGFYGITDDNKFVTVKDGDEISTGRHTLKFIMTPMVHWPETMMTYIADEKTLFSGDAFGTFGALDGSVTDDEMDCSLYFDEMYRYYSNIVGKYGRFVDNAFKKVAGLDIDCLCTTHGPVWQKHLEEVFEIYSRLCHYQGEDGLVIVYASMYGNTEKLANSIAGEISRAGYHNVKMLDASSTPVSFLVSECFRYDKLIIGSPTYQMDIFPAIDHLLKALEIREIKNKRIGFFASYTWAPKVALQKMKDYAVRMNLEYVGSVEMKQGLIEDTTDEIKSLVAEILKNG